jgi:porphobilinogen synthase
VQRPRRLRSSESMRRLVRETRLHPANFILPLFICPGEGIRRPIGSMPRQRQLSIDTAVEECREIFAFACW